MRVKESLTKKSLSFLASLAVVLAANSKPALALETSTVLTPKVSDTDFALDSTNYGNSSDIKELESVIKDIEQKWNDHKLDAVMDYYADDYVNNDGLTKKAVKELTSDFWKTYPDARSSSKVKAIRVEGKFATVESRDKAVGSTAKEMPSIGSKGVLTSISEGQLYLRKIRGNWKIVGDRVDFEKVKVAFGIAQDLNTKFIAPELVKSGQEYTAKLSVALPNDFVAVGSIASEPLKYPQPKHQDIWRPVENKVLERIIHANKSNHNELLMATIGITDKSRTTLKGLTYLTRRMNVVPQQLEVEETPHPSADEDAAVEDIDDNGAESEEE